MKTVFLILTLSLYVVNTFCQTNFKLEDPLPIDPAVKVGKLENGLTYYIRQNKLPEKRVEMRLVINAGSLQETDNQQGLAHFVEHMCFNGTENFEKNELVDFLEQMGIKFGAELNAYTSFEETVYQLYIPTDKPGLLDTAFMVLEDWASKVSFAHDEIDKERGVIVEEWRLGLGAQERMMQKYVPVILKDSRYAERLPIGKMEVVENCPYDTLKQFYYDWYRPDLMAVVVVGDIEIDEMEEKINDHFSKLVNPEHLKPRVEYPIPNNKEPLISIVTDKEATYSIIQFYIKHDKKNDVIVSDYRNLLMQGLYNQMMNTRFAEVLQSPDAPFMYASSSYGGFLGRSKDAYSSVAVAKENEIINSFKKLLKESEKVRQFGFTSSELERVKKEILTMYEKAVKEKDKTESRNYAEEYKRSFLEGEAIPGIENEYAFALQFVPGITLEEVNQLAKNWVIDENWVILVTAPENEKIDIPKEEDLMAVVKASKEEEIQAYVDAVSDEPLLAEKPKKTKVKSKIENEKLGYTELVFKNGAKAVLKPNFYKNDQIIFMGISPGGHSIYPDEDFISADFASDIINQSGLGNFDAVGLQKKLAGNTAGVSSWINTLTEGTSGSCSPKDIETLLQLNYLYFTAPRKDTNAFKVYISKLENQIKFVEADPNFAFYDTLVKVTTMNHPRSYAVPTFEQLNQANLDKILEIQEDRFADASDFNFIFVGNFAVDTLIPLLETYIGGLPSINRDESWKNVDPDFPEGITEVVINKGIEPKSRVQIVMNEAFEYNAEDVMYINILIDILSIKLRESMREDQGGVYGVRISESIKKYPVEEYSVTVSFGCSPDNVDSLVNTVFTEMKKIQDNGPEEIDLNKVKETLIRGREVSIKTNSYWKSVLNGLYFSNRPILTLDEYKEKVNNISAENIKKAAIDFLNLKHYVKVVLMPEGEVAKSD